MEVTVAMLFTTVALLGLLNMLGVLVVTAKLQGDSATAATTLAANKIEELMGLDFSDAATDTTVTPSSPGGGTGLCGEMAPGSQCGSVDPDLRLNGFTDYLDESGGRPNGTQARFVRQWRITADPSGRAKEIEVRVQSLDGRTEAEPATTVSCLLAKTG